jgi:hypothetical protein
MHLITDSSRKSSEALKYFNGITAKRVIDHLKANTVDVDQVPSVMGPLLTMDPQGLRVSGEDREIDAAASRSPLFKRQGREGFRIPALTA